MVASSSDTPDGKSRNRHKDDSSQELEPPTPTEVVVAIVHWFQTWWEAPREKSKAADWFTAILTVVIAAAAIWSAFIFQGQLNETTKQTRLSVRPWIGLDEGLDAIEATPLQIDETGNASLVYKIRAKNYSSTPATNVWAFANLVVADDLYTVYEQQNFACGDAVIGKPDIGLMLFQGKDRIFNSMPSMAKISLKHQGSRLQVFLAGCIGYRDQFGYLCRTKFIWMLHDDADHIVSFDPPTRRTEIIGHFAPTHLAEL